MSKLRIVVVGPGLIGKQHIRCLVEREDCELAAIVAPDRPANHQIASDYKTKLYTTLSDCNTSENFDGVVIASPNRFHFDQARFCIERQIPVLIEKPITPTLTEGLQLVDLIKRFNAKAIVGHHRAHSPLMATAREVIRSDALGRLVSIVGSAQFHKPTHYFDSGPWRKEVGGGPILINLIHEIGNLRSLIGEISAVQAITSSAVRGFVVEDTVAINFMFVNGALGTFMLSDTAASASSWEQTSQENPSYPAYTDEDCYAISGTLGSLSVPSMQIKRFPLGTSPSWWTRLVEEKIEVVRKDPLSCQMAHFVSLIKDNAAPIVSALDGLRNLQVTEAVRESARERRLVYLNTSY